MLSIGKFFERIQNIRTKEVFVRMVIRDALKRVAGVEVPIEAISFSSTQIVLKNIPQAARSVLFIKKGKLIEEINTLQQIRKITDIR